MTPADLEGLRRGDPMTTKDLKGAQPLYSDGSQANCWSICV
jgi:hypothetical protein